MESEIEKTKIEIFLEILSKINDKETIESLKKILDSEEIFDENDLQNIGEEKLSKNYPNFAGLFQKLFKFIDKSFLYSSKMGQIVDNCVDKKVAEKYKTLFQKHRIENAAEFFAFEINELQKIEGEFKETQLLKIKASIGNLNSAGGKVMAQILENKNEGLPSNDSPYKDLSKIKKIFKELKMEDSKNGEYGDLFTIIPVESWNSVDEENEYKIVKNFINKSYQEKKIDFIKNWMPYIVDIITRQLPLEGYFILPLRETIEKKDPKLRDELDEVLYMLSPSDLLIVFMNLLDEGSNYKFCSKLIKSGYPTPIVYPDLTSTLLGTKDTEYFIDFNSLMAFPSLNEGQPETPFFLLTTGNSKQSSFQLLSSFGYYQTDKIDNKDGFLNNIKVDFFSSTFDQTLPFHLFWIQNIEDFLEYTDSMIFPLMGLSLRFMWLLHPNDYLNKPLMNNIKNLIEQKYDSLHLIINIKEKETKNEGLSNFDNIKQISVIDLELYKLKQANSPEAFYNNLQNAFQKTNFYTSSRNERFFFYEKLYALNKNIKANLKKNSLEDISDFIKKVEDIFQQIASEIKKIEEQKEYKSMPVFFIDKYFTGGKGKNSNNIKKHNKKELIFRLLPFACLKSNINYFDKYSENRRRSWNRNYQREMSSDSLSEITDLFKIQDGFTKILKSETGKYLFTLNQEGSRLPSAHEALPKLNLEFGLASLMLECLKKGKKFEMFLNIFQKELIINRQKYIHQIEYHKIFNIYKIFEEFNYLFDIYINDEHNIANIQWILSTLEYFFLNGGILQVLRGSPLGWDSSLFHLLFSRSKIKEDTKKIKVISVCGAYSSGKSTLLNYLFSTNFVVSSGKCTKGIYVCFFKLDGINCLCLDSEGTLTTNNQTSEKKKLTEKEKKLNLFNVVSSDIVLLNHKGEINETIFTSFLRDAAIGKWQMSYTRTLDSKFLFVLKDILDNSLKTHEKEAKNIQEALENLTLGYHERASEFIKVSFNGESNDRKDSDIVLMTTPFTYNPYFKKPLFGLNQKPMILVKTYVEENIMGLRSTLKKFFIKNFKKDPEDIKGGSKAEDSTKENFNNELQEKVLDSNMEKEMCRAYKNFGILWEQINTSNFRSILEYEKILEIEEKNEKRAKFYQEMLPYFMDKVKIECDLKKDEIINQIEFCDKFIQQEKEKVKDFKKKLQDILNMFNFKDCFRSFKRDKKIVWDLDESEEIELETIFGRKVREMIQFKYKSIQDKIRAKIDQEKLDSVIKSLHNFVNDNKGILKANLEKNQENKDAWKHFVKSQIDMEIEKKINELSLKSPPLHEIILQSFMEVMNMELPQVPVNPEEIKCSILCNGYKKIKTFYKNEKFSSIFKGVIIDFMCNMSKNLWNLEGERFTIDNLLQLIKDRDSIFTITWSQNGDTIFLLNFEILLSKIGKYPEQKYYIQYISALYSYVYVCLNPIKRVRNKEDYSINSSHPDFHEILQKTYINIAGKLKFNFEDCIKNSRKLIGLIRRVLPSEKKDEYQHFNIICKKNKIKRIIAKINIEEFNKNYGIYLLNFFKDIDLKENFSYISDQVDLYTGYGLNVVDFDSELLRILEKKLINYYEENNKKQDEKLKKEKQKLLMINL